MAIRDIYTHTPTARVDNISQAKRLGRNSSFVESRLGFRSLARVAQGEGTKDLALAALQGLFSRHAHLRSQVSALVLVTQSPDFEGIPHTSAWLQSEAGLGSGVACFDVGLGCSGYTFGLAILEGFLRSTKQTIGALVTADPYSPMVDPMDLSTAMIFGDAATATWLDISEPQFGPGLSMLASDFGTDGSAGGAIARRAGVLHMDGRSIYGFAKREIPRSIRRALERAGISEVDVSAFVMHQGSRAVVDAIAHKFPGLEDRFVWSASSVGNTVSSSVPMALAPVMNDPGVGIIVATGFGVGLSWGTVVLARSDL